MKLVIAQDAEQASLIVARIIIDQVKSKADSWIMLPSGPTPTLLYKQLCEAYQRKEVTFKQTHFIAVDEYIGLKDEKASVSHQLQTQFFSPCQIDAEHVLAYDPFSDPHQQAKSFNQILDQLENEIDLIVTGIGQDGHIAYNQPNNTMLYPHIHLDHLSESTRQGLALGFDDITEVPNQILTIGM
ncbi:MAG: 6-phosphogluconolactonase [Erysipelotrichaceae bacterium]